MCEEKNIKSTSNITNWLMVVLTIILVGGTIFYQHKNLGFAYRPYVGIVKIVKIKDTDNELSFKTELKNTGAVPANNIRIRGSMMITGIKKPLEKEIEVEKTAILFPEASIKHPIWLKNETLSEFMKTANAIWKIKYLITYDGIHTKSHKTTVEAFFDRESKAFHYESGYAN